MINFLLSLSLILNIVALFCIVILYLRQNRLLEVENKQEKLIKEMEEVISSYLIEMTEENEKFIDRVRGLISKPIIKQKESPLGIHSDTERPLQEKDQDQKNPVERQPFKKGTVFQAAQAYKNTLSLEKSVGAPLFTELQQEFEHEEKGPNEQSLNSETLFDQALLLKKQGLTTEDIARRLNKGKTEIELLLKLRQNEKE
jgi:hypothetical protein